MCAYISKIRRRKNLRTNGFDYSRPAFYFITICVKNNLCLFGYVENGTMVLNDAGKMVEKWYVELENKFPDIKCREIVVMPNHMHCIIQNTGGNPGEHIGSPLGGNPGEHVGSPLGRVIQWFKTMTTNEYIRGVKSKGWQRFDGKLWQRNYWERKIFGDDSYKTTVKYIIDNPMKWKSGA